MKSLQLQYLSVKMKNTHQREIMGHRFGVSLLPACHHVALRLREKIKKIFYQWQMTCSPPVAEETAANCSMRLSLSLSEAKRFKRENIMNVIV